MMRRVTSLGFELAVGFGAGRVLAWSGVIAAPDACSRQVDEPASQAAKESASAAGTTPDAVVVGEGQHSRFAILAQQSAPGVVNVHTSKTVKQSLPDFGFPFGDLFGDQFGGPPARPSARAKRPLRRTPAGVQPAT